MSPLALFCAAAIAHPALAQERADAFLIGNWKFVISHFQKILCASCDLRGRGVTHESMTTNNQQLTTNNPVPVRKDQAQKQCNKRQHSVIYSVMCENRLLQLP